MSARLFSFSVTSYSSESVLIFWGLGEEFGGGDDDDVRDPPRFEDDGVMEYMLPTPLILGLLLQRTCLDYSILLMIFTLLFFLHQTPYLYLL